MIFFLVFLISIYILYRSSGWVIKYSLLISEILGLSTFVIGFILVSIATTLPELFVSVFSALRGEAGLAVGTIIGSSLADLTIILGLTTILGGAIYLKKKESIDLIELLFITSLITIMIFQTGTLGVIHGIILLVLFFYLVTKLYRGGRVSKQIYDDVGKKKTKEKVIIFLKFGVSISILIIASHFLVESALQIADFFSLAATFIGVTIVALGTSTPELSVEVLAVKKGRYALAAGDLFGAAVINMTLVLGSLSILNPVAINVVPLAGALPFLLISTLVVWYIFNTKGRITRYEGIILIALYGAFLMQEMGFLVLT